MINEPKSVSRLFLESLIGKQICIRLKWGNEFIGTAISMDSYMNIHLDKCTEQLEGQESSYLGEVLIRCNNILYIREHEGSLRDC